MNILTSYPYFWILLLTPLVLIAIAAWGTFWSWSRTPTGAIPTPTSADLENAVQLITKASQSPAPSVEELKTAVSRIKAAGDTRNLHWQAIDYPIHSAITAAGVAVPLVIGLLSYLTSQGHSVRALTPLIVSVILVGLSVFVGLWCSFSVATQARSDNAVLVDQKRNTSLPAMLVVQFASFAVGIGLLIYYVFSGLSPHISPSSVSDQTMLTEDVKRPPVQLGTSVIDVRGSWGKPTGQEKRGNDVLLTYQGPSMEYVITFQDDRVVSVHKRVISPKEEKK